MAYRVSEFILNRVVSSGKLPDSGRVSWPFKDMLVGDVLNIYGDITDRASVMCHVYGKSSGMKFKTRKQKDGTLSVQRIK